MSELYELKCEVCRKGAPPATDPEITEYLIQLPDWQVCERAGINQLERAFVFRNFAEALFFTQQVGALAEANGHHPTILTEWGRVTVTWWTHKIGGLHQSDFIMASKTERLGKRAIS